MRLAPPAGDRIELRAWGRSAAGHEIVVRTTPVEFGQEVQRGRGEEIQLVQVMLYRERLPVEIRLERRKIRRDPRMNGALISTRHNAARAAQTVAHDAQTSSINGLRRPPCSHR